MIFRTLSSFSVKGVLGRGEKARLIWALEDNGINELHFAFVFELRTLDDNQGSSKPTVRDRVLLCQS